MTYVVDVNVAIVANRNAPQASADCIAACAARLQAITRSARTAIDSHGNMIREYARNLKGTGQPGVGDAFFKWLLRHQANPERCDRVSVVPHAERGFESFPGDPSLKRFDPSDRVYVAVAAAHPELPPILQAVDTKWWPFKDTLRANGIQVEFLCDRDVLRML